MSETVYPGRCLCRGVRYEAHGPWRNVCHCHCESCRRAAGAPFVSWGTVDRDKFAVVHGALSFVRSSQDVERGFCGACGTTLTYAHARRDQEIDVTLASLEDPSLVTPRAHIWVRDKLPWIEIEDGLPQYSRVLGMDEAP